MQLAQPYCHDQQLSVKLVAQNYRAKLYSRVTATILGLQDPESLCKAPRL